MGKKEVVAAREPGKLSRRRFGAPKKRHTLCRPGGKIRYRDSKSAAQALRTLRAMAAAADADGADHTIAVCRHYKCPACKGWHLTSWAQPEPWSVPGRQATWVTPKLKALPRPGTPAWRGPVPAALHSAALRSAARPAVALAG